jgi:hypothetical protein
VASKRRVGVAGDGYTEVTVVVLVGTSLDVDGGDDGDDGDDGASRDGERASFGHSRGGRSSGDASSGNSLLARARAMKQALQEVRQGPRGRKDSKAIYKGDDIQDFKRGKRKSLPTKRRESRLKRGSFIEVDESMRAMGRHRKQSEGGLVPVS